MKSSSISVSNSMVLSVKEWIITICLCVVICLVIYHGWSSWEYYEPGQDHRETCWAELQSDYWAYMRWCRYAKEHYDALLIGDSVFWGQEVRNDETISHYLNEFHGKEVFANAANDGLFMAGINGIVTHYGDDLDNTNIILQFNPLWLASKQRDLRGEKKSNYHHPRLIPQLDSRITYYHNLNTRLGYLLEHYCRVFPFVRHLMANYFENKSVSGWIMEHPYRNPFASITFEAAPVMAESQGRSLDWMTKEIKVSDYPFVEISESIQFECFVNAIKKLSKNNSRVFILLGPFNHHMLTPESRERLFDMMDDVKKVFDDMGYPYFDTLKINLPSNTFADTCHLLKDGHIILAREIIKDTRFQQWLKGVGE
ncbi:MAG: hypothetical protein HOC71_13375 [Candidatus Latescibacteria bacterium]|jgi:hypothetical protein|nr:hypothetical protein [Candidatus Latescibacterota bacterium]